MLSFTQKIKFITLIIIKIYDIIYVEIEIKEIIMLKEFMEDTFLYNTIKEVTGWNDDAKIKVIFDKLHSQTSWRIQQIEAMMEEM